MRNQSRRLAGSMLIALGVAAAAIAGNAHFVGTPSLSTVESTAFASGKVAGLGNIPQIHVTLSADAACVNPGSHKPAAANKQSFNVSGDFPVQNGRASFTLALEATFQPDCTPPMSVEWSNLRITVTADDGTFLTYP